MPYPPPPPPPWRRPPQRPNLLAALMSKVHVEPIHFRSPAQRQAALLQEQADIARQARIDMAKSPAGFVALTLGGIAIVTGLTAGASALVGGWLEPNVPRGAFAKVGAVSYLGATSLILGAGFLLKKAGV